MSDSQAAGCGGSDASSCRVGVFLPCIEIISAGKYGIAEASVLAEELNFDSVWVGDHLTFHTPLVEALISATVAAAVTSRIGIGTGVLIPALRQPAWVAKQIASLQVISGDRLQLGIGVGGEHPAEWAAARVDPAERGRLTNALLAALPDMLAGKPALLGPPFDMSLPPIEPHGAVPPIWIGGRASAALTRTIRYADGWLGMWLDEERVRMSADELRRQALAANRRPPAIGALVFCSLGKDREAAHDQARHVLQKQYAIPYAKMRRYVAAGRPYDILLHLRELAAAGVRQFVLFPASTDWEHDYRVFADIRDEIIDLQGAS